MPQIACYMMKFVLRGGGGGPGKCLLEFWEWMSRIIFSPTPWAYVDQGCELRSHSRVGLCIDIEAQNGQGPVHVGLRIDLICTLLGPLCYTA